jgi:hypothetical protein
MFQTLLAQLRQPPPCQIDPRFIMSTYRTQREKYAESGAHRTQLDFKMPATVRVLKSLPRPFSTVLMPY